MDTAAAGVNQAESDLITQAQSGNTRSFSALVALHEKRALHTAYSFLGNWEDARDAAQDAFVKAYQALSGFRGTSRFFTWFYRILVNVCKDELRRRASRGWMMESDEEKEDLIQQTASREDDAFKQLTSRELFHKIQRAISGLPFRQQSVFTLRYMEGLSLDEIAETLDITTGAVKANLWQATDKMKKVLSGGINAEAAK